MIKVIFTPHARKKFEVLKRHNFTVSESQVTETVQKPDKVDSGKKGRKIAQKGISTRHVLRVIYEEKDERAEVVTFYPGRRERYENELR